MARSDLLLSIVRAGAEGNRTSLRTSVEALMAEERAKNHNVLADRLQRALNTISVSSASEPRTSQAPGRDAVLETVPSQQLSDLILPLPVLRQTTQLIEEHQRADLLRSHGMQPRHRVLLSGPPGNGKTSIAEAIAEALALPLFTVRYDALIGSFLGETNTRLRKLFDYIKTTPCVIFFDEFDAIGKERGDNHETGEIKRVVSFLLMQIDQLPSYVINVAATNHAELLDRAVWRRFQIRLDIPSPTWRELSLLIERQVSRWDEPIGLKPDTIAKRLGKTSFAETLEFCQTVRRRHILSRGQFQLKDIVREELELWNTRTMPGEHGSGSEQTISET